MCTHACTHECHVCCRPSQHTQHSVHICYYNILNGRLLRDKNNGCSAHILNHVDTHSRCCCVHTAAPRSMPDTRTHVPYLFKTMYRNEVKTVPIKKSNSICFPNNHNFLLSCSASASDTFGTGAGPLSALFFFSIAYAATN